MLRTGGWAIVRPDARSFRIALVADALVNPAPGQPDALAVLAAEDWAAMKLPPTWFPLDLAEPLLAQVAEQAEEFARHGYDLVLLSEVDAEGARDGGVFRSALGRALGAVGLPLPPEHTMRGDGAERLRTFLRSRPLPAARIG